jgi:protein-L-isoaspartate(D-aspartate) O-methyltransferase
MTRAAVAATKGSCYRQFCHFVPGVFRRSFTACCLLASLLTAAAGATENSGSNTERDNMLEAIEESVRQTAAYTGRSRLSARVMQQMAAVPRHEFVPEYQRSRAYLNTPLSIGHKQTISQPLIVALMTDFLEPEAGDVMLEVGTGSGYQAAVLSGLVQQLYSIEIIPELASRAATDLERLGYDNVEVKAGDGYLGWPEHAPFDGIIVTAAADEIPAPLLEQLKVGAKLLIPVASAGGYQELLVVEKSADGTLSSRSILPVRFVPLTGDHQDTQ